MLRLIVFIKNVSFSIGISHCSTLSLKHCIHIEAGQFIFGIMVVDFNLLVLQYVNTCLLVLLVW